MRIETSLLENFEKIYEIKDAWSDLVPKSASQSIFSLPEWSIAYLKTLGANCRLHIALAWDDGELVGVMPLVEKRGKAHDLFLTRFEPVGGQYADYQAPIIKNGLEDHILEPLLAQLPHDRQVLLRWPHLPENHPTLPLFRQYFHKKKWPWFETSSHCTRYVLPNSYHEIEKSWGKNHRKDVKRRCKRLREKGRLTLEVLKDSQEIQNWLIEFFKFHSQKWHAEGLSSIFDDIRMKIYYQEIARQLASKGLHISSLKLNDTRIAYVFGFLYNNWYYSYLSTYLREYLIYSPRKVHVSMLMEYGCNEGWEGFDFLQGDESYKEKWSSSKITCVTFNVGINGGGLSYKWVADYEPILRERFGAYYTRLRFLLKGRKWI